MNCRVSLVSLAVWAALTCGCGRDSYFSQVQPLTKDAGLYDVIAADAREPDAPGPDAHTPDTQALDTRPDDAHTNDAAELDAAMGDASVFEPVTLPPGGEANQVAISVSDTSRHYSVFGHDHMFRSDDVGVSWTACAAPGLDVYAIVPTRSSADSVYAGVDGDLLFSDDACQSWRTTGLGRSATQLLELPSGDLLAGTDEGLWRRSGQAWSPQPSPLDGVWVSALAEGPTGGTLLGASNGLGITRSDNGGVTWSLANTGLEGVSIYSVAIDMQDPQHAMACGGSGVYRSDDGGSSWNRIITAWSNHVAIDPADGSKVIVATSDRLRTSTNGGTSFASADCRSAGMNRAYVNRLVFSPDLSGALYAATGRGLFTAADLSCGWGARHAGVDGWVITAVATAPVLGDVYLATTAAVLTSHDGFTPHSSGFVSYSRTMSVSLDADDEGVLYASAAHQLQQSIDRGQTFTQVGVPTGAWAFFVTRARGQQIFGGTNEGLRYSLDGGTSWVSRDVQGAERRVQDMLVLDWSTPRLLLGTDSGVFMTDDLGLSWTSLDSGLTGSDVRALAVRADGSLLAGAEDGVYAAVDLQSAWSYLGPTGCEVEDLMVEGSAVVVACMDGVHTSLDAGLTWQPLPGLEARWPYSLGMDSDGQLLVGTYGYGLYRADMPQ